MSVHTKARHTKTRTRSKSKARKQEDSVEIVPWREAFKKDFEKYSESGVTLRGARYKKGVTQAVLSKAIGVSPHHISEMENGKRPIGKEMAKRFAKFFETDYRVFL